jgi:hypothetical protein
MVSETFASNAIKPERHASAPRIEDDQLPYEEFFTKTLELYEITSHAVRQFFSEAHTHNQNADGSGIINTSQEEKILAIIIQVDGCLSRWEQSLPAHLKLGDAKHQPDDICRRQSTVLHLR